MSALWLVVVLFVLWLWLRTGKDPLLLAIHGLIWLRAAIALGHECGAQAWRGFRVSLPGAVRSMRGHIGHG